MPAGYPPSDEALRKWLLQLNSKDQKDVAKLLHGFLFSLLNVTLRLLKDIENGDTFLITPESRPNSFADPTASKQIPSEPGRDSSVEERQRQLACHFREKMTTDSDFENTNTYRQSFFNEVTEKADKVGFRGWSSPFEDDHPIKFAKVASEIHFLEDITDADVTSKTKQPVYRTAYVGKLLYLTQSF